MSRSQDHWTAEDIGDQTGRTFVITGANSGLGYHMTAELAGRGGHVVMAVRNIDKGEAAAAAIRALHPTANLDVRHLDLSDLDSVRAFAGYIHPGTIDVLVNNAGIMMPPRSLTRQGFESQFGTNHLGHFALTGLLLPKLRLDNDPRVVTLSSTAHRSGRLHFDDINGEHGYSPWGFYCQSKFANTVFGLELDRRLRAASSPVKSILAHPGYSATNLQFAGPTGRLTRLFMRIGNRVAAQDASIGVLPQLYAAVDPAAESGQFIGPDGRGESRGYPRVVQPVESAQDPRTAERLWGLSEELTGIHFEPQVTRDA